PDVRGADHECPLGAEMRTAEMRALVARRPGLPGRMSPVAGRPNVARSQEGGPAGGTWVPSALSRVGLALPGRMSPVAGRPNVAGSQEGGPGGGSWVPSALNANLTLVPSTPTLSRARAAKAEVAKRLAGHPLVNGIGIARVNGGYAVKVNLTAAVKNGMPRSVGGVP